MNLVKVITLARNNTIIEDFILYYGDMFGFSNVVIVDNGSTLPTVLDVYKKYASIGVVVKFEKSHSRHSTKFMSKHMHAIASSCVFMLPVQVTQYIVANEVKNVFNTFNSLGVSTIMYGEVFQRKVEKTTNPLVDRVEREFPLMTNIIVRSSKFLTMNEWPLDPESVIVRDPENTCNTLSIGFLSATFVS
jgi:hypothetical protein